MKGFRFLSVLLVMVLLVGCSSGGNKSVDTKQGENTSITLRYSVQQPVNSASHESAKRIKEIVEKETNGSVKIDIYPAAQLGDWIQVYDELMMGTIDIANTTVPDTYNPQMAAGFLPYLASNYEELRKVFAPDSFLVKSMEDIQSAQNVKFLGYFCDGFCGVSTNKDVTNANVSDKDKGILIRVPSVDAWKFPFDRLGFRTSTIPYADVYASMQTGVVDGFTGTPPYIVYEGYRDVVDQYYVYNAVHESTQLLMSEKTWDKLTENQQEIIKNAFDEEAAMSIDISEKSDIEYLNKMKEAGMKVVEFTDEEMKEIARDVRDFVWKQLEKEYTAEFLNSLRESIE